MEFQVLDLRLSSGLLMVRVLVLARLATVVVASALLPTDGAEGGFEEAGGLLATAPGVADSIDRDRALGADPDVNSGWGFHGSDGLRIYGVVTMRRG